MNELYGEALKTLTEFENEFLKRIESAETEVEVKKIGEDFDKQRYGILNRYPFVEKRFFDMVLRVDDALRSATEQIGKLTAFERALIGKIKENDWDIWDWKGMSGIGDFFSRGLPGSEILFAEPCEERDAGCYDVLFLLKREIDGESHYTLCQFVGHDPDGCEPGCIPIEIYVCPVRDAGN